MQCQNILTSKQKSKKKKKTNICINKRDLAL